MSQSPRELPRGVRRLFAFPSTRESLVNEADEELQFHMEMWKAEYRKLGMSDAEADAEALRRFGDAQEYRNYTARRAASNARVQRVVRWFAEWMQDVSFAARQFRKAPAFSAIIVLTLALGIGANTAVFSVVHHLLIAPLPYANGNRLVALRVTGGGMFTPGLVTVPMDAPQAPPPEVLQAWTSRAHSLEKVAGFSNIFLSTLPNGQQDTVTHALITANFLPLLGAQPAFGRLFRADEEHAANNRVAMISYAWWQRAYGGRETVIGQIAEYEGNPYTIVGVMPRNFVLPMTPRLLDWLANPSPDVYLPAPLDMADTPFGLLRTGYTANDATSELQAISNSLPVSPQRGAVRARAMRAQDFLSPKEVRTVEMLFAAAGVLLLIACANVANLLLVRAWTRRGEFAIRMGLGAGRARLVRLALTESVLLAIAGGAIGVAVAWQGIHVISLLRPLALDSLADLRIEPAVFYWTLGISILTGVLFGGAAAFVVGSRSIGELLRGETRASTGATVSRRIHSSLIVLEIALSLTLLVGAGLLLRSFAALQQSPLGFTPHNLVSIDLLMPSALRRSGKGIEIREAILQQLRETPGVTAVAVGTIPMAGSRGMGMLVAESATGDRPLGVSQHTNTWITSNYFRTTGIALIAGRTPETAASDEVATPPFRMLSEEIVVNRAFAKRISPNGNVIGQRVRMNMPGNSRLPQTGDWSTIVGVSEDVHLPGARSDLNDYQVYTLPLALMTAPAFVVRMTNVPSDVESVLRQRIQNVNPTLIARRARVADDYLREAMAPTQFAMALLGAFAFVALVLAVVGLYGSITYSVSQRTREIGIRVALGATPRAVMRLILRDGVRLVFAGLVIGIAAAAAATQTLSHLLYAVTPNDPITFVLIALIVAVIAVFASCIPARRAVRIDPVQALRAD